MRAGNANGQTMLVIMQACDVWLLSLLPRYVTRICLHLRPDSKTFASFNVAPFRVIISICSYHIVLDEYIIPRVAVIKCLQKMDP